MAGDAGLMAWGKRAWRESEVNRDRRGRFAHKPRGSKAIEGIKATARRLMDFEDRRGPRLRWGEKGTRGWWYIPKGGATYWVRRERQSTWIRGYYYVPDRWMPVVGPGQFREYLAPEGTPLAGPIPDDVWRAAQSDMIHKRDRDDPSAKSEAFKTRRQRSGAGDEVRRRGLMTVQPTRKKRARGAR